MDLPIDEFSMKSGSCFGQLDILKSIIFISCWKKSRNRFNYGLRLRTPGFQHCCLRHEILGSRYMFLSLCAFFNIYFVNVFNYSIFYFVFSGASKLYSLGKDVQKHKFGCLSASIASWFLQTWYRILLLWWHKYYETLDRPIDEFSMKSESFYVQLTVSEE